MPHKIREALGIVTCSELAETLQVTEGTLREWRRLNTGPAFVRVGKQVVYYLEDVQQWLVKNRRSLVAILIFAYLMCQPDGSIPVMV